MGGSGCTVPGASVCTDWSALLHRGRYYDHAGCVAVLDDVGGTRDACVSHEQGGVAAARIFAGADRENSPSVQDSTGLEAEYLAGAGAAEGRIQSRGGCGYAHPVH